VGWCWKGPRLKPVVRLGGEFQKPQGFCSLRPSLSISPVRGQGVLGWVVVERPAAEAGRLFGSGVSKASRLLLPPADAGASHEAAGVKTRVDLLLGLSGLETPTYRFPVVAQGLKPVLICPSDCRGWKP
jgi:hypothetical protein